MVANYRLVFAAVNKNLNRKLIFCGHTGNSSVCAPFRRNEDDRKTLKLKRKILLNRINIGGWIASFFNTQKPENF